MGSPIGLTRSGGTSRPAWASLMISVIVTVPSLIIAASWAGRDGYGRATCPAGSSSCGGMFCCCGPGANGTFNLGSSFWWCHDPTGGEAVKAPRCEATGGALLAGFTTAPRVGTTPVVGVQQCWIVASDGVCCFSTPGGGAAALERSSVRTRTTADSWFRQSQKPNAAASQPCHSNCNKGRAPWGERVGLAFVGQCARASCSAAGGGFGFLVAGAARDRWRPAVGLGGCVGDQDSIADLRHQVSHGTRGMRQQDGVGVRVLP